MTNNPTKIGPRGLALIKQFEKFIPHAYDDADPRARPIEDGDKVRGTLTIGYGHVKTAKPGMRMTRNEANNLLIEELKFYERLVAKYVTQKIRQNQYDALVSFCYNIGPTGFRKSTVLRKLNEGDDFGAAEAFMMWVKTTINGERVVSRGLVRRRKAERALFLDTAPEDPTLLAG